MPRKLVILVTVFSLLVFGLWAFPFFWYRPPDVDAKGFSWLAEQTNVAGWKFSSTPVGKAAEAVLVADRLFNGEFSRPDGATIQAYGAKRYIEKENEIGLFSHTPDRCWTAIGWSIEPGSPDHIETELHGLRMILERRIFVARDKRQLVYFGAVVGGKPLPYRLDQYRSAASQPSYVGKGDTSGTWRRLAQTRLWGWAWESFVNRTPLAGPQQFIRISTPINGVDPAAADQMLKEFLPQWLKPTPYRTEFDSWRSQMR